MSLKAFHVFFISVAVLLAIGFGVWCLREGDRPAMGVASFVVAAALVVYEILFLKKLKTK